MGIHPCWGGEGGKGAYITHANTFVKVCYPGDMDWTLTYKLGRRGGVDMRVRRTKLIRSEYYSFTHCISGGIFTYCKWKCTCCIRNMVLAIISWAHIRGFSPSYFLEITFTIKYICSIFVWPVLDCPRTVTLLPISPSVKLQHKDKCFFPVWEISLLTWNSERSGAN